MPKVAHLLSGGVDSAVSAYMLQKLGYDVECFFLKIFITDGFLSLCPWQEDLENCQKVCARLGLKLNVINLEDEYYSRVVEYVIESVKNGSTPNPDVLCNKEIKFGAFQKRIDSSFEFISSGHYARNSNFNCKNNVSLAIATDRLKDQSYFLCQTDKNVLKKVMFPLGDIKKTEVRSIAKSINLPNAGRPDSQGICFLGKFKFKEFVDHYVPKYEGLVVELESNKNMRTHEGFWHFTIGQREGIGLAGGPFFVVSKDVQKNIVYVSKNKALLYVNLLKIRITNIINESAFVGLTKKGSVGFAKIRHEEKIWRYSVFSSDSASVLELLFDENFYMQSVGQFVSLYFTNDELYECFAGALVV